METCTWRTLSFARRFGSRKKIAIRRPKPLRTTTSRGPQASHATSGPPTPEAALLVLQTGERARARTLLEALSEGSQLQKPAAFPKPQDIRSLADFVSRVEGNTAVISFSVLPDRILAFVVDRRGIRLSRLAAKPQELAEKVANYVDLISRDEGVGWLTFGNELFGE